MGGPCAKQEPGEDPQLSWKRQACITAAGQSAARALPAAGQDVPGASEHVREVSETQPACFVLAQLWFRVDICVFGVDGPGAGNLSAAAACTLKQVLRFTVTGS